MLMKITNVVGHFKLIHRLFLKPFTQGIGSLAKLQVLDVAGNKLSMFPVEVQYIHFIHILSF